MKLTGLNRRGFFAHCLASLGGSLAGGTAGAFACSSTWNKPVIDKDKDKGIEKAIRKLESYGYRVKATITSGKGDNIKFDYSYAYRDIGNPIVSGIAGGNVALPIAKRANKKEEELTRTKGPDYFEGEPYAQPIPRRYFMTAIASGALVGVPIGYGTEVLKIPSPDEQREIDRLVKMLTDSGYKVVHPRAFSNRQIASVAASTITATATYVASRAIYSDGLVKRLDAKEQANKIASAKGDAVRKLIGGNHNN